MSASLVGSEMCIRDRRHQLSIRVNSCPLSLAAGAAVTAVPSPAEGRIPVSYTHLTLPTICSV
eukprot:588420-Alexandrium_andersonii.AAC.1